MSTTPRKLSIELLESRELLSANAYRTIDGTGNNIVHPQWGSTDERLLRLAAAEYGDGKNTPGGQDRPGARDISNVLVAQDGETANDRQMTAYSYIFGQFLDHDLDLTPSGGDAFDIEVPGDDQFFFDPIPFTRSQFDSTTGTNRFNPRQQINTITAWIDGSQIYGSDPTTAASLRAFVGGRLKTSVGPDGALPPTDADGNFLAGDTRANENIELTSMHALFVREHNYWAAKIAAQHPTWRDQQIYNEARAWVGAELQVIVYKEYLPSLGVTLKNYQGYKPGVNPGISNEFSTAAFRLHTLINDDIEFFGNDGRATRDEIALAEGFFNPSLLAQEGIAGILKYGASTHAQELDNHIVDSLRNFLFGPPGAGGMDLASLNIQRGRDHGLADYNAVRKAVGLPNVDYAGITWDDNLANALESLYGPAAQGGANNIDLWVGLLAENHAAGSSMGETQRRILADQFQRLRDGDRLWYQKVYSGTELANLEKTTLGAIIKRNTTVSNLQVNVFHLKYEVSGTVFRDANRNGVFDTSRNSRDTAVRNAIVLLLNDEGEVIATTRTDSSGKFTFEAWNFHETGDYSIQVGRVIKSVLASVGDQNLTVNFATV